MLDIIIPAYNAHNTLNRCLSSIAMQTMIDDIQVTIVDDHSDKGYDEFVKNFSPLMKIQVVTSDVNVGPGIARQIGVDNTHGDIITFIDADDTFYGAFSLDAAYRFMMNNEKIMNLITNFIEEVSASEHKYLDHKHDNVWVFGKFYRRSFLEEKGIRFSQYSRSNEDNGFNKLNQLAMDNPEENLCYMDLFSYIWHETKTSITRINNAEYTYTCVTGYTQNMAWAITEALKHEYNFERILDAISGVTCFLYGSYVDLTFKTNLPKQAYYIHLLLSAMHDFYYTVYRQFEDTKPLQDRILGSHEGTMQQFYDAFHKHLKYPSFPEFITISKNYLENAVKEAPTFKVEGQ